jgi:hypothetical protein
MQHVSEDMLWGRGRYWDWNKIGSGFFWYGSDMELTHPATVGLH